MKIKRIFRIGNKKHIHYFYVLVFVLIEAMNVTTLGVIGTTMMPILTGCGGGTCKSGSGGSCSSNCDSLLTGEINLKQWFNRMTNGILCGNICTMEIQFVDVNNNPLSNVVANCDDINYADLVVKDNGTYKTLYNGYYLTNSSGFASLSLSTCIPVSDVKNNLVSIDLTALSQCTFDGFIYVENPDGTCEIYAEEWNTSVKFLWDPGNCAVLLNVICKDTGHSGPCPNGC